MSHKNYENNFIPAPYNMYGKHVVLCALNNPNRKVEQVICTNNIFQSHQDIIAKFKYQITDNQHINKILGSDLNHQGLIAKLYPIYHSDISKINFSDSKCNILILDQVTDPQNIGSILRSAAAFDVKAVILPQDHSVAENATIAKVASGSLELVQIIKVTNLRSTMEFLKKQGFWIVGMDGSAESTLNNKMFSNKTAIVVGAEGKGLRALTKSTCDFLAKIPISEQVESLNVNVATSIALYLLHEFNFS